MPPIKKIDENKIKSSLIRHLDFLKGSMIINETGTIHYHLSETNSMINHIKYSIRLERPDKLQLKISSYSDHRDYELKIFAHKKDKSYFATVEKKQENKIIDKTILEDINLKDILFLIGDCSSRLEDRLSLYLSSEFYPYQNQANFAQEVESSIKEGNIKKLNKNRVEISWDGNFSGPILSKNSSQSPQNLFFQKKLIALYKEITPDVFLEKTDDGMIRHFHTPTETRKTSIILNLSSGEIDRIERMGYGFIFESKNKEISTDQKESKTQSILEVQDFEYI